MKRNYETMTELFPRFRAKAPLQSAMLHHTYDHAK